jgi:4-hydroxymandelate oxidase
MINVFDYEALARNELEPAVWDFVEGGSGAEATLQGNGAAFARHWLRPRVLVDVSACDTATTVLGTPVRAPILVAPLAYQGLVSPDGECATARGVAQASSIFVVSTMSSRPIEQIAACAGVPWLQVSVLRDRAATVQMIRRAEACGVRALVLTVDAPRVGRRERDRRNAFAVPAHLEAAHAPASHAVALRTRVPGQSAVEAHARDAFDPSLTWDIFAWMREHTALPIVVKGILTAEDARLAADHGAAGIVVSNHGGRQLDGALPSLDALEECVAAVAGACEVYLDGGVRRGTDVLKALALGARAVLVGRPILWGLAAAGADGVAGVLELIRSELEDAMCLAGCPSVGHITPALVRRSR